MTKAKGTGKRKWRTFRAEFEVQSVRLPRQRKLGVNLAQIGRELNIRPDVVGRWARQVEDRAGRTPRDVFRGMESCRRPRRLRRENAVLRQERDFLKHAAAFFAKESRLRTPASPGRGTRIPCIACAACSVCRGGLLCGETLPAECPGPASGAPAPGAKRAPLAPDFTE